jgi:hypothetical protein
MSVRFEYFVYITGKQDSFNIFFDVKSRTAIDIMVWLRENLGTDEYTLDMSDGYLWGVEFRDLEDINLFRLCFSWLKFHDEDQMDWEDML